MGRKVISSSYSSAFLKVLLHKSKSSFFSFTLRDHRRLKFQRTQVDHLPTEQFFMIKTLDQLEIVGNFSI